MMDFKCFFKAIPHKDPEKAALSDFLQSQVRFVRCPLKNTAIGNHAVMIGNHRMIDAVENDTV